MKSVCTLAFATLLTSLGGVAQAQAFEINNLPPPVLQLQWTCTTGAGQTCSTQQLTNPAYRQVLILPTGYTEGEYAKFFGDADQFRVSASDVPGEAVFTDHYRDRILYLTYWAPGASLPTTGANTASANFQGAVVVHPIRGYGLTLNQTAVYNKVDSLKDSVTGLNPTAVVVIFNTDEKDVTGSASEPSFTRRSYGIARVTRADVSSSYVPAHQLGHALLSWVDEYVEPGFENMNVGSLDVLTPTLLFNGSLQSLQAAVGTLTGLYDMRMSEILANNGADNVSTSPYPSTVYSGLPQDHYEYEGGMFFGHGTYHQAGKNLMNNNDVIHGPDDGFAYAHSPAQQRDVTTAFDGTTQRANDRIRNAGPKGFWQGLNGANVTLMMFDADKNHRWHPTQQYQVRLGYYAVVWSTCWWGPLPYPCYSSVWTTVQKTIYPTRDTIDLKESAAYGLANLAQDVVCQLGLGSDGSFDLCTQPADTISAAFLPTYKFYLPYQTTDVPVTQWFTTYYWSFKTFNGTYWSGWTPWASYYATL